jgi:hypothetical protein
MCTVSVVDRSDAHSLLRAGRAHSHSCDACNEYSRDSGVEIQPGDFGGTRILCKTATRLAKQTRPVGGENEVFNCVR